MKHALAPRTLWHSTWTQSLPVPTPPLKSQNQYNTGNKVS